MGKLKTVEERRELKKKKKVERIPVLSEYRKCYINVLRVTNEK